MTEVSNAVETARLPRLTGLRGPAALLIFFTHTGDFGGAQAIPGYRFLDLGYVGVTLFFAISGLVLAWGVPAVLDRPGRRRFYGRRFARIVPLHVLTTALALLVVTQAGVGHVLAAIFLVQTWYPLWHDAGNPVSWSLCCELFFYALLPFFVLFVRRKTVERGWSLAVAFYALTSVVLVVGTFADGRRYDNDLHWQPLTNLAPFLLGAAAGLRLRSGWRPRWATWRVATPLLVLGVLAVGAFRAHEHGRPGTGVVITLLTPVFVVLVITCARADLDGRRGLLSHPTVVFAGEVSFAFYLIHFIVIEAYLKVIGQANTAPALLGLVIVTFVLSAVAAVLLHRGVELPARRRIQAALNARSPQPARPALGVNRDQEAAGSLQGSPNLGA